jgi:hypothetical protein
MLESRGPCVPPTSIGVNLSGVGEALDDRVLVSNCYSRREPGLAGDTTCLPHRSAFRQALFVDQPRLTTGIQLDSPQGSSRNDETRCSGHPRIWRNGRSRPDCCVSATLGAVTFESGCAQFSSVGTGASRDGRLRCAMTSGATSSESTELWTCKSIF